MNDAEEKRTGLSDKQSTKMINGRHRAAEKPIMYARRTRARPALLITDRSSLSVSSPSSRGSVMLEFVIAFPLVLVLLLMVIQLSQIWIARMVVHYAAFCAARAALVTVCEPGPANPANDSWPSYAQLPRFNNQAMRTEADWAANQAAAQVCAWISIGESAGEAADPNSGRALPGWGKIPGSGGVERKTFTTISEEPCRGVSATVRHDFAMIVPIVGPMLGWGMNPWDPNTPWAVQALDTTGNIHTNLDMVAYPHIRLQETVFLPKPYRTIIAAGNWASGGGW